MGVGVRVGSGAGATAATAPGAPENTKAPSSCARNAPAAAAATTCDPANGWLASSARLMRASGRSTIVWRRRCPAPLSASPVAPDVEADAEALLAASLDALSGDALARASTILTSTSDAVNQGELSTTDLLLARRARADLTFKVMDLRLQLFLVKNELRQVLGTDAPVVRRIQGATWPTR